MKRNIKEAYREIFRSYGHSTLEKHIQKIIPEAMVFVFWLKRMENGKLEITTGHAMTISMLQKITRS